MARQRLVKIAQPLAVLGRDRDRLAQPQPVGLGQAVLPRAALALVGDQDHLGGALAQPVREGFVERQDAGAGVDQEQHDVGGFDSALGEAPHARFQHLAACGFPAGGVEQREGEIAELRRCFADVARHAGLVVDQRMTTPDQPVEQSRFANVGPADDATRERRLSSAEGNEPA